MTMGLFGSNKTISRLNDGKKMKPYKLTGFFQAMMLGSLMLVVIANLFWVVNLRGTGPQNVDKEEYLIRAQKNSRVLRRYPPHRYYKLNMPIPKQPDFLTKTEYIHGEWPGLLQSHDIRTTSQGPFKLTVDQSEWLSLPENDEKMPRRSHVAGEVIGSLPFADGTNPSILTMTRVQKSAPSQAKLILEHFPGTTYIATACMTTSQCAWKDSPQDIENFHVSTKTEPDTVRTVVILLDRNYKSLAQTTLFLEHDAKWGRKYRSPPESDGSQPVPLKMPAFDDARLFVHDGQIYVSFREGKGFGYESQVLNPIHWQFSKQGRAVDVQTHTKASESSTLCCGRNMALMAGKDEQHLQSVTWVDPITTVTVDTTPGTRNKPDRQLAGDKNKKKKSHIHGTNAFMVKLPKTDEDTAAAPVFLGVAHFHRPNDRKENPYARFGHHYTHAFFTIQNDHLVGLSAEFLFPSAYHPDDAEIIQFASGLEYDEAREHVVIAYGINDCEAAITAIDVVTVRKMLRPVESGKEVLDYMKPLKR